jgi:L-fuconolactonase
MEQPLPRVPLIDAHIHLYDPSAVPYGWMAAQWPELNRPQLESDFDRAHCPIAVEGYFACEAHPDDGHHASEASFLSQRAARDRRLLAITALARVERGAAVARDLDDLAPFSLVRGIRVGLAGRPDRMAEPLFVEGVRTVGRRGLHYEIAVQHTGLSHALMLARACPDVSMILDHIGMPDIKAGIWQPWCALMADLARHPNVAVKISGAMAGAGRGSGAQQVSPFVRHAIDCFGFDRSMFASDWPALTRTGHGYADWITVVEVALAGATGAERRQLYRDTAKRLFRLGATVSEKDLA